MSKLLVFGTSGQVATELQRLAPVQALGRDTVDLANRSAGAAATLARAIAAACLEIARQLQVDPGKSGTYHFTGAPNVSWCDFARAIFAAADRSTRVQGIPTLEYPTPASRPLNSRLGCCATETAFNIPRPDWRAGLSDTLTELGFSK